MGFEEILHSVAGNTALAVEGVAVVLIAYGGLEVLVHVIGHVVRGNTTPAGWRKAEFVRLGVWLLLGLQFALAADIVRSVISPTWNDIGQLAAIAVIRTFLNHFLEKDLDEFSSSDQAPGRS